MNFNLTENQVMNLLVFLDRVNCTGREAFAMVELLNLFGNNKKDEGLIEGIKNNKLNKKDN